MNAPLLVSVVVPHYRDLASLDLCLAALERQTFPREGFEIVVADNASPEGREAVETVIAGRARLTIVPEKGAGPARNGGVAVSRGEILAFTDCDCQPEPQWLAEAVRALDDADFVGGGMKVLVDDPGRMTPSEAFEVVFAFQNETYVKRKGFTVTANLACPRRGFDQVGGFRVGVSEDYDWSQRATAAGFRIGYAGRAMVGHPARRTWPDLLAKWRRLNVETYAVFAARPMGRLWWFVRSLALPFSALAHTPRVLFTPKLTSFAQRRRGLAALYRLRLWRGLDCLRLSLRPPPG